MSEEEYPQIERDTDGFPIGMVCSREYYLRNKAELDRATANGLYYLGQGPITEDVVRHQQNLADLKAAFRASRKARGEAA